MGRRSRWSIVGRGSPSARGYLGSVRQWWRSWVAWALGVAGDAPDDQPVTQQDVLGITVRMTVAQDRAPPPPSEGRIAQVGAPVAMAAGRHERRLLRRAGMPREVERSRLGIVEGSPISLSTGLELPGLESLGGVEATALREWAQEGVDLIRAVPRDLLSTLPDELAAAVTDGATWRTLRDTLRDRLGVSERHLELIARDQVAKLNSRVTEATHRAAGVTSYVWRANMDERTRDTHRAADGTIVAWDSPGVPGTGFYGEPSHAGRGGQCRCTAEPVPPPDWR